MQNINPDIIIGGVFLATLLLMAVLFMGITILAGPQRDLQRRLDRFKERFAYNRSLGKGGPRSIIISTNTSSFEQALRQIIPRPGELRDRLSRTGRDISLPKYVVVSVTLAVVSFIAMAFMASLPPFLAGLFAFLMGVAVPHLVIGRMISKRIQKFTKLFPEAIDLIVRGLKSGLPINESIAAVGRELADPVGVEFRGIADAVKVGKTLEEALWLTATRLNTPDFKFFVISLAVQKETGGNLAETLGNLSDILRKRQQLKLKIKAMAAEGKASAYIIGSLPFVMFGLIRLINPEYAAVLYTDPRAIVISFIGLFWMAIGVFVIAKMINFEY